MNLPNNGAPFTYLLSPPISPEKHVAAGYVAKSIRRRDRPNALSTRLRTAPSQSQQSLSVRVRKSRPSLLRRAPLPSYRRVTAISPSKLTSVDSSTTHSTTAVSSSRWSAVLPNRSHTECSHLSTETIADQLTNYNKRLEIAREILTTEQRYVDTLEMIQVNFIEPLVASLSTHAPLLSQASISHIFSNFVDIVNVNGTLLEALQMRLDPDETGIETFWQPALDDIGDIFCSLGPFLSMYKIYCRNFTASIIALEAEKSNNKLFNTFLKSPERRALLMKLSLGSHLLLPVQRVPRYQLLLSQLLHHTPEDHSDHGYLVRALTIVSEIASGINETIRKHEAWQQIRQIEQSMVSLDQTLTSDPTRIFIKRGPVSKVSRKSHQLREMFLFNDCLIYATPTVSGNVFDGFLEYYIFNRRLALPELTIEKFSLETSHGSRFCIRFLSTAKSFLTYYTSEQIQTEWFEAISRAKLECMIAQTSFKMNSQDSIGTTAKLARRSIPFIDALMGWNNEVEYPIFRGHSAPIVSTRPESS